MYSIPVLDLYADASFNIRTQTTNFSADGLHPIQPGHDLMAQKISRFINSL
jgi:lysophospholipase L1-like esterase